MKKYLPILCIAILFTACFNSRTLDEDKALCMKENKNFYVTEILDDSTQNTKLKVICK